MKRKTLLIILLASTLLCFSQEWGNASYYSRRLKGHHTSDGGHYQPDSLTCAHRKYPLGTYLMVRNPKNNISVVVKVTDRGPRQKRLMIDLSYRAAQLLDIVRYGISRVEIGEVAFRPNDIPSPLTIPVLLLTSTSLSVR